MLSSPKSGKHRTTMKLGCLVAHQSSLVCLLTGILLCNKASTLCREFSGQSGSQSPQRSAHSVGVLPGGGVAVGAHGGSRGLAVTKASGLSSSKKRGDAMRRSEHC